MVEIYYIDDDKSDLDPFYVAILPNLSLHPDTDTKWVLTTLGKKSTIAVNNTYNKG